MAEQNIQIKSKAGDLLYPKTKGSLVYNNSNQALGTVEAGAQVNVIETIKVNGSALTPANKAVDITIAAQAEYTIAKAASAESGYAATYNLKKDGVVVGASINIPKDMVVSSGEVKTCSTADTPVTGYKVGDKYIDLVLANADSSHIYILVSDLIDVYTAGTAITISGNQISVNIETLKSTFAELTDLDAYQPLITSTAKVDADLIDDSTSTNKFVTASDKTAWNAKQNAIDSSHKLSADLVDDTTSTNKFVTASDKTTWSGKQDAINDLATIRSGAAAGATAVQPADLASYLTYEVLS